MISTEQFSRKVILVILLLIGANFINALYPVAVRMSEVELSWWTLYSISFITNALIGVILVLQQPMNALLALCIILLSMCYPIFGATLYLISISVPTSSEHEY